LSFSPIFLKTVKSDTHYIGAVIAGISLVMGRDKLFERRFDDHGGRWGNAKAFPRLKNQQVKEIKQWLLVK